MEVIRDRDRGFPAPADGYLGAGDSRDARSTEAEPTTSQRARALGSSRYGYTFRRVLLGADLLALTLAAGLASGVNSLAGREPLSAAEAAAFLASVGIWVLLAGAAGLYHVGERRVDHTLVDEISPVFMVTTTWAWVLVLADGLISSRVTPLLWPAVVWAGAIILVLMLRAIARTASRNRDWYRQPVVLIGDGDGIDRVLRRILRHPEWGLDPVATIRWFEKDLVLDHLNEDSGVRYSEQIQASNGNGSATVEDLTTTVQSLHVSRAIIAGGSQSLGERTELIRVLARKRVCVDYVSGEPEALYSTAVLHHLEGLPVLTVQPTRLTRTAAGFKRGFDLLSAGVGLAVLSPLLAYSAIRIKLDSPGPVLFASLRVGRHGETFQMLKFRTMVQGADQLRCDVRENSIHTEGAGMLKLREDPRVTKFGAKLRRWSVDELPQLWNVVRGEMSLVGPRPLPLDEAPLVKDHFLERTRMRPGITGPWQTQGRSDIPFEDMVKLDYTYVVGWSMREDFRLLLRTAAAVFGRRGAY